MDIYESVKAKYKRRKVIAATMIAGGCLAAVLTVVFMFVGTIEPIPVWNQYHYWAAGLMAVLVTGGAMIYVFSSSALRDIEKTVNRLCPDERELTIQAKAKSRTLRIYNLIIFPAFFIAASALLMLGYMSFVGWLLIIGNYLALLITWAFIRRDESNKH